MKKFLLILISILLLVVMAVPTFAATADELGLPSPNSVWVDSAYPYAVITHTTADNQYYLHLFKDKPFAEVQEGGVDVKLKVNSGGYQSYRLNTGLWDFQSQSDSTLTINFTHPGWVDMVPADRVVLWTSSPILYGSSTIVDTDPNFFPKPLFLQVQEVTTETVQGETVPAVVGTMKVLTLCGVGLIALLVVLKLFGKRSLISLR